MIIKHDAIAGLGFAAKLWFSALQPKRMKKREKGKRKKQKENRKKLNRTLAFTSQP